MAKKQNRIVEAADEEGIFDEDFDAPQDEDDGYEPDFEEGLTTDEVNQLRQNAADKQASQQRGKKGREIDTSRRPQRVAETPAQAQWRERQPARTNTLHYTPASTLEAPPPRPGMEQRWVRVSLGSEDDPKNLLKKSREGWVPRPLESVPEGYFPPTLSHGKLGNVIGVDDLVLCEMDERLFASRKKYFRKKYERQIAGIERRRVSAVEKEGHEIQVNYKRDTTSRAGSRRPRAQSDE